MRPEGIKLLPWLVGGVDLVMITIATVLAIRFRVSLPIFDTASDVLENTALASGFFIGTWIVLLAYFRTYELDIFGAGTEEFKLVVNASFYTGALVATIHPMCIGVALVGRLHVDLRQQASALCPSR